MSNILTSEQQAALVRWKCLLDESGLDDVLKRDSDSAPPAMEPKFQVLGRLFVDGSDAERRDLQSCAPEDVIAALEAVGVLRRADDRVSGAYGLVNHLGTWMVHEKLSPSVQAYYGYDAIELSRTLIGAQGSVLDLCAGVGAQGFVCARTANHVTAVEIEAAAEKPFWINAAMNGFSNKVDFKVGDLFEPVKGRTFDVICCNPPFLPVPPSIRYPCFADGGPQGLGIVRRVIAGLPEALTRTGRCEMQCSVLGNREGPDWSPFKEMAAESGLAIMLDCRTHQDIEGRALKRLVSLGIANHHEDDAEEKYRTHFASLNATRIFFFLLHAQRSPSSALCVSYPDPNGKGNTFEVVPLA